MDATAAFVLGAIAGLAVGAVVVAGLLRAVGRITGVTDWRGAARLVGSGLLPQRRRDGVAVQRALARRVRHTGSRTASGGTVAAAHLDVHVGPADFAMLEEGMGLAAAGDDLAAYYVRHAREQGWTIGRTPTVAIVRDISLRDGQAFTRPTVRPVTGAVRVPAQAPESARPAGDASFTDVLTPPHAPAVTDVLAPADAALTDVLPAGLADPALTAVLPTGPDHAAPGDLVIVHGTDVRTIPASRGRAAIGRGPHNDLVIERPGIARDHVVVEHRTDGWWVVPGSAPHGTLLDARPLERPARVDGQASLTLGRGVRLSLTAV